MECARVSSAVWEWSGDLGAPPCPKCYKGTGRCPWIPVLENLLWGRHSASGTDFFLTNTVVGPLVVYRGVRQPDTISGGLTLLITMVPNQVTGGCRSPMQMTRRLSFRVWSSPTWERLISMVMSNDLFYKGVRQPDTTPGHLTPCRAAWYYRTACN